MLVDLILTVSVAHYLHVTVRLMLYDHTRKMEIMASLKCIFATLELTRSILIVTGSVARGFLRKGWQPRLIQKRQLANIPLQKIKNFILQNTSIGAIISLHLMDSAESIKFTMNQQYDILLFFFPICFFACEDLLVKFCCSPIAITVKRKKRLWHS
jgi:hypothetical protein